ncbi:ABC transporter permease [Sulfitobacter porphyrae]|uniref:ABC transporter permease n=1 Tax=Sulfitobacter porphyrae TaxID=1246864 RepID=A0ABW2B8U0_9RHOB
MLNRIVTKLLHAAFVLLATNIISFSIFSFAGSPVDAILGETATAEERAELAEDLGFNDPVHVRFANYAKAVQGDFGRSLRSNEDIGDLITTRFPATMELVIVATILTLIFGIPLGLFSGMKRRKPLAKAVLLGSLYGISMPNFLLGLLLIFLFSVQLGWLPAFGRPGTVDFWGWETSFLTIKG